MSNHSRFETLIRNLLPKLGYIIDKDYDASSRALIDGPDLIAHKLGEKFAFEIKHYRSQQAQPNLLDNAAKYASSYKKEPIAASPILITSTTLSSRQKQSFRDTYGVTTWDRLTLEQLIQNHPDLHEELYSLTGFSPYAYKPSLDPSRIAPEDSIFIQDHPSKLTINSALTSGDSDTPQESAQPSKEGSLLSNKLKSLPTGKKYAIQFETLGQEILKHLFSPHLVGWLAQKTTSDELNRYDCTCRVDSQFGFWAFLLQNLNSRYVVFEFKNYEKKITQSEITTTEKYLFEKALRKTAIIISRKGAEKNAIKMAEAAIRESGKLLVTLSDEDIHNMLRMKDKGDDPSDYLFDLVDNFLLSLSR